MESNCLSVCLPLIATKASVLLSVWENLMEEISKLEFSREGIYLIVGILSFLLLGIIVVSIKERIERKKEHPPPPPHHHHHHYHHRTHTHKGHHKR